MMEGYTKFPNSLFDWLLAKSPELSKREIVILLAVIRNTIGWNRKKSQMSCRFLQSQTGMDASNVNKAIHSLAERSFISVDRSGVTATVELHDSVVESTTAVWLNQPQQCGQINHGSVVKPTTEPWSNQPQINKGNTNTEKNKDTFADWLTA